MFPSHLKSSLNIIRHRHMFMSIPQRDKWGHYLDPMCFYTAFIRFILHMSIGCESNHLLYIRQSLIYLSIEYLYYQDNNMMLNSKTNNLRNCHILGYGVCTFMIQIFLEISICLWANLQCLLRNCINCYGNLNSNKNAIMEWYS